MLEGPSSLAYVAELIVRTLEEDYDTDPAPLLEVLGTERAALADGTRRFSNESILTLWEKAGDLCDDPAFGVRAGLKTTPLHLNVIGHAWMSSATLADAFERLLRYEELIDTGVTEIRFEKVGDVYMLSESYPNPADYHGKLGADMAFAGIIALCRAATDTELSATHAEFILSKDDPLEIYAGIVAGPVKRSRDHNALFFKATDIEAPLPGAQPDVADATSHIAERYIRSLDRSNVANQVREVLVQMLPSGSADQEQVAAALFRSASTLQRQLKSEGTSYREVSDHTRQRLAEAYLKDGEHSHAQIAFLTGFGNQSNFSRAFKRWTGKSPGTFQKKADDS